MPMRQLRPVGNRFNLSLKPFDQEIFSPFKFYGYGSGTQALAAAISAVKEKYGSIEKNEILIPAYTCPDVISACQFAGVKVRLVDLAKNSCRMDLDDLKLNLSQNTLAVIAINFLGIPENIKAIRKIAGSIPIIEDSAQGMFKVNSEEYWQGDLIVLSFGRGKPLNLMSGGAILTKDSSWEKLIPVYKPKESSYLETIFYLIKLRLVQKMFNPRLYYWVTRLPGANIGVTQFKPLKAISSISSSVLFLISDSLKQLRKSDSKWKKYYHQLKKLQHVILVHTDEKVNFIDDFLLRFPVLIETDDKNMKKHYKMLGINSLYSKTIPNIEGVPKEIICNCDRNFPNAEMFASRLITLPCYNDLDENDMGRIIKILENYLI
jgi:dTDP-4-amino-4,6-dideoxygalactose transaminase